jgi:Na+/H+-dicarboxylate symporter
MGENGTAAFAMPEIRVPVAWTLGGLVAGLALGIALAGTMAADAALGIAGPLGRLWLRALQMTIIPLVAGLLVIGIGEAVAAARAGVMARRTLGLFAAVLAGSAVAAALLVPLLLDAFPLPETAAAALRGAIPETRLAVPEAGAFIESLIPANVFAAAANDAILPVIVFIALLGVAITRLPEAPRAQLTGLFAALAGAMLIVIGWVLQIAPLGVFCLALGVGVQSGTSAIGALAHYIVSVGSVGGLVLIAA